MSTSKLDVTCLHISQSEKEKALQLYLNNDGITLANVKQSLTAMGVQNPLEGIVESFFMEGGERKEMLSPQQWVVMLDTLIGRERNSSNSENSTQQTERDRSPSTRRDTLPPGKPPTQMARRPSGRKSSDKPDANARLSPSFVIPGSARMTPPAESSNAAPRRNRPGSPQLLQTVNSLAYHTFMTPVAVAQMDSMNQTFYPASQSTSYAFFSTTNVFGGAEDKDEIDEIITSLFKHCGATEQARSSNMSSTPTAPKSASSVLELHLDDWEKKLKELEKQGTKMPPAPIIDDVTSTLDTLIARQRSSASSYVAHSESTTQLSSSYDLAATLSFPYFSSAVQAQMRQAQEDVAVGCFGSTLTEEELLKNQQRQYAQYWKPPTLVMFLAAIAPLDSLELAGAEVTGYLRSIGLLQGALAILCPEREVPSHDTLAEGTATTGQALSATKRNGGKPTQGELNRQSSGLQGDNDSLDATQRTNRSDVIEKFSNSDLHKTRQQYAKVKSRYMEEKPMDEISASVAARAKARKVIGDLRKNTVPINRTSCFARAEKDTTKDEEKEWAVAPNYLEGMKLDSGDDDDSDALSNLNEVLRNPNGPQSKGGINTSKRPSNVGRLGDTGRSFRQQQEANEGGEEEEGDLQHTLRRTSQQMPYVPRPLGVGSRKPYSLLPVDGGLDSGPLGTPGKAQGPTVVLSPYATYPPNRAEEPQDSSKRKPTKRSSKAGMGKIRNGINSDDDDDDVERNEYQTSSLPPALVNHSFVSNNNMSRNGSLTVPTVAQHRPLQTVGVVEVNDGHDNDDDEVGNGTRRRLKLPQPLNGGKRLKMSSRPRSGGDSERKAKKKKKKRKDRTRPTSPADGADNEADENFLSASQRNERKKKKKKKMQSVSPTDGEENEADENFLSASQRNERKKRKKKKMRESPERSPSVDEALLSLHSSPSQRKRALSSPMGNTSINVDYAESSASLRSSSQWFGKRSASSRPLGQLPSPQAPQVRTPDFGVNGVFRRLSAPVQRQTGGECFIPSAPPTLGKLPKRPERHPSLPLSSAPSPASPLGEVKEKEWGKDDEADGENAIPVLDTTAEPQSAHEDNEQKTISEKKKKKKKKEKKKREREREREEEARKKDDAPEESVQPFQSETRSSAPLSDGTSTNNEAGMASTVNYTSRFASGPPSPLPMRPAAPGAVPVCTFHMSDGGGPGCGTAGAFPASAKTSMSTPGAAIVPILPETHGKEYDDDWETDSDDVKGKTAEVVAAAKEQTQVEAKESETAKAAAPESAKTASALHSRLMFTRARPEISGRTPTISPSSSRSSHFFSEDDDDDNSIRGRGQTRPYYVKGRLAPLLEASDSKIYAAKQAGIGKDDDDDGSVVDIAIVPSVPQFERSSGAPSTVRSNGAMEEGTVKNPCPPSLGASLTSPKARRSPASKRLTPNVTVVEPSASAAEAVLNSSDPFSSPHSETLVHVHFAGIDDDDDDEGEGEHLNYSFTFRHYSETKEKPFSDSDPQGDESSAASSASSAALAYNVAEPTVTKRASTAHSSSSPLRNMASHVTPGRPPLPGSVSPSANRCLSPGRPPSAPVMPALAGLAPVEPFQLKCLDFIDEEN